MLSAWAFLKMRNEDKLAIMKDWPAAKGMAVTNVISSMVEQAKEQGKYQQDIITALELLDIHAIARVWDNAAFYTEIKSIFDITEGMTEDQSKGGVDNSDDGAYTGITTKLD